MDRIQKNESKIFTAIFLILCVLSFLDQRIYAASGRYFSLAFFGVLVLLLLPHAGDILKETPWKAAAVLLTGLIAMGNLMIIGSNKGAVLIPSDLALISLAFDRVALQKKDRVLVCGICGGFTILWYPAVRWSYNFNMAGLSFMLFMIMSILFLEYYRKKGGPSYLFPVQILMGVTAFFYATLYHSRCAMIGILVFAVSLVLLKYLRKNRILYCIFCLLLTLGSVAFTALYVASSGAGLKLTFLYKDILSGRQDIWSELWEAFLARPFTGIGSSYVLKSFEIFEVHNGLFDILVVHGILVFLLVLFLLLPVLFSLQNAPVSSFGTVCTAAVFGMLAASFFENFFTVPPYSLFFLFFLLGCKGDE